MNNIKLAQKVKELRTKQDISQEKLAEDSGLSLRTIQRIENNETVPRGDTLKRIAISLNSSPDEIIDWKIREDKKYLAFMNIYALGFLLFPLLGIIIPLTMWVLNKDKIKNVDQVGRAILNFQITWSIILFLYLIFASFLEWEMLGFLFISIPIIILYIINFFAIIVNTIRVGNNKPVKYRPSLPILR